MAQAKTVSKNTPYVVFGGLALLLLAMGVLLSGYASSAGSFGAPNFTALIDGWKIIITHPSMIDFDGLWKAGHLGSAFFNSGVLTILILLLYKLTKTDMQGVQIAALMMVLGFSFYGKNPLNIWFPIIGVLLHTKISGKALNTGTALAAFSTALSPVFSQLAFGMTDKYMNDQVGLVPQSVAAYILAGVFGLLAGYLISVLAGYLPSLHKGYVLYNAGFAAGLAGLVLNSFLKAAGLGHDAYRGSITQAADYTTGNNLVLGGMLAILFVYLIVAGFALGGGGTIGKMVWHASKGGNFVEKFGFAPSLINMGIMGFMATAFVFLTSLGYNAETAAYCGQLAGPVFGCIWTAAGFAANGVTVRMYWPTMAGVYIGAFLFAGIGAAINGGDFVQAGLVFAGSRGMLLAAIFSCGLAPIVGDFGVLAGLFVGITHSVIVVNVGVLHGFMSLYNNGLSLSLIATFLYPIYSKLGGKKEEPAAS